MNQIKITELINPQPKQLEALRMLLDPKCKYLLYGGAMSGGKSYLLRWGALAYSLYLYRTTGIKGIPIGLFSEDYPTLKDRQISRIQHEFPAWLGTLKNSDIDGLAFTVADEYGGGKILLRNLDDPSKYMSTEFAGEFVEELTRNQEQTFMELRNRLRYPGIDQVKFMGATNPGGVGHGWVKKLFIDHNTQDPEQNRFYYVHANAYDNQYISPEYIKQLESLPENLKKAYLEGSWDVFAGQYFPEIGSRHRIVPFVPRDSVITGGMDWGRANPFSFHLATINKIFYRGDEIQTFYRVKTFFEVYGKEKNPAEWSELIIDQLDKKFNMTLTDLVDIQAHVMCDSMIFNLGTDGSKSIFDQFVDADKRWMYILKPAAKGPDSRVRGWQNMHTWLSLAPDGEPYWQWTTTCTELDRTLPQLIHDENNIEDVESSRKGGIDDDCGDDQRYMLQHITFLDGKTGQIRSKKEYPSGNRSKFFGENEDAGQLLILDTDKFK